MTIQALWLLSRLKYVQKYKDAWFAIDDDKNVITVYVAKEDARKIKLRGYLNSLGSTLSYLADLRYIEIGEGGGHVLHAGWHWGQIIIGKISSFLFRSIVVPVVVAFLTALVTIWLKLS